MRHLKFWEQGHDLVGENPCPYLSLYFSRPGSFELNIS